MGRFASPLTMRLPSMSTGFDLSRNAGCQFSRRKPRALALSFLTSTSGLDVSFSKVRGILCQAFVIVIRE